MERHFKRDVDEFVLPKYQEELDWFPQPDDWSEWGITAFGSSAFPKKQLSTATNSDEEEFINDFDISSFVNGGKDSNLSEIFQGAQKCSFQWSTDSQQSDYQIEGTSEICHTDNISLKPFLKDSLTGTDNFHGSFGYSQEYQNIMIPDDGYLMDSNLDLLDISDHMCGNGLNYLEEGDIFTSSMCLENGELASSSSRAEPLVERICLSPEQNFSVSKDGTETSSMEEIVLLELQKVASKLTEKTRNCFRDALFRLANNSKRRALKESRNGDKGLDDYTLLASHNGRSGCVQNSRRMEETEPTEASTNAIDRAIANLMFDNMDLNMQNISDAASWTQAASCIAAFSPLDFHTLEQRLRS